MPLGFERLNERTQRPNAHINFIRPLPGPSSTTAEGILNRVAAQCYPFMKKHTILVQALEEFPFNNEFVGRNFNAGEVIQLVLRNRKGEWLPERWVMMVMVHELAHCKQMNHSKAFWAVRDAYAVELRELWAKGYTGEGLWGRGRELLGEGVAVGSVGVGDVPEYLCGGTYRRGKRRRRGSKAEEKPELTYAEKKARRILKKFGAGGKTLGGDDDAKIKLEGGVVKKGKPRVAGSVRGRELRAAAALARFDVVKKEDEYESAGAEEAAIDVDGKKMVDDQGRALVKVCEDEDGRDEDARREMAEFEDIELYPEHTPASTATPLHSSKINIKRAAPTTTQSSTKINIKHASAKPPPTANLPAPAVISTSTNKETALRQSHPPCRNLQAATRASSSTICPCSDHQDRDAVSKTQSSTTAPIACPVCSLINDAGSMTCMACSNVLNPRLVPSHWRCRSAACGGSQYINAGDVGLCGLCGTSRGSA